MQTISKIEHKIIPISNGYILVLPEMSAQEQTANILKKYMAQAKHIISAPSVMKITDNYEGTTMVTERVNVDSDVNEINSVENIMNNLPVQRVDDNILYFPSLKDLFDYLMIRLA